MSRIYDHLKSLETQIEQEKVTRGKNSRRDAYEEPAGLAADTRRDFERGLHDAGQVRIQEAAITEARKREAEEKRKAEDHANRFFKEAHLHELALERSKAEGAERAALALRIEAEQRLAAQLAARIEQENIEREQAAQRAQQEKELALAAAAREEQERKLQQRAIEEARVRAEEESRRLKERTARLAEEARLEALARDRALAEQAEREVLAARVEAERLLATQLSARIEQENFEREQAAQRAQQEKELALAAAAREEQERKLQQRAIEEARVRAEEESRRLKEHTARLAEEARLEALARDRALAEQAEREVLAARVDAEHQLAQQLKARLAQEKMERTQAARRIAEEEKLRQAEAKREERERRLQERENMRLQQAAAKEARKREIEEARQAEIHAVRLAQEVKLEEFVREREKSEQAQQAALASRIEVERQLAARLEIRIEKEKIERAQAARSAEQEEELKLAAFRREENERRLQALEQVRLQEAAIAEARRRAAEETMRAEVHAARLDGEARLKTLALERAIAEQAEQNALAARIEAERQLSARIPPVQERSRKVYFVLAPILFFAGLLVIGGVGFYGKTKISEHQVASVSVEQTVPLVAENHKQAGAALSENKAEPKLKTEFPSWLPAKSPHGRESKTVSQQKQVSRYEAKLAVVNLKEPENRMDAINNAATDTVASDADIWERHAKVVREELKAEAYAEASSNAQVLARDFPERWEPWFWLGTAQLALGQMDAADSALEHAGRLDPAVARVWIQRGVVAQERGDHAAALKMLNQARTLSPKSAQIYLDLGYSYDALKLAIEAENNYRLFLSLTEGNDSYAAQRNHVIKRLGGRR